MPRHASAALSSVQPVTLGVVICATSEDLEVCTNGCFNHKHIWIAGAVVGCRGREGEAFAWNIFSTSHSRFKGRLPPLIPKAQHKSDAAMLL